MAQAMPSLPCFLPIICESRNLGEALSSAVSAIFGVLAKTAEKGAREIQLVSAQDEIVKPSRMFKAEALV